MKAIVVGRHAPSGDEGIEAVGNENKDISQIPQIPMTSWEVAGHMFGQDAVSDYIKAADAAVSMEAAGWVFFEYDPINGEEVWGPPPEP